MKIGDGYLSAPQAVEISIEEGRCRGSYRSYIEEIRGSEVLVAAPMSRLKHVVLPVGTEVSVVYKRGSAVYGFKTRVKGNVSGRFSFLVLELPGHIYRTQRRNYFRLEVDLPLSFWVIANPGEEPAPPGQEMKGRLRDLSGGGIMLVTRLWFDPGTELLFRFELPGGYTVLAGGNVVRLEKEFKRGTTVIWWYGIRFTGINRRDQDAVVRFIFQEQRKRRQKGLI